MKLTEYIEEAISSGKHGGLSRVINLDDFHKKLIDTLALAYELDEFPGPQKYIYKERNYLLKEPIPPNG